MEHRGYVKTNGTPQNSLAGCRGLRCPLGGGVKGGRGGGVTFYPGGDITVGWKQTPSVSEGRLAMTFTEHVLKGKSLYHEGNFASYVKKLASKPA